MKKVVVIGAGAAGMMAAATAANRGLDVTLIEKNHIVGRKILILSFCFIDQACQS